MIRQFGFGLLLLTIAGSFGQAFTAEAQPALNLTVTVSDLRNQDGNVCLKLFSGSEGFPNNDEDALQITCVPIDSGASGTADSSTESPTAESTDEESSTATPSPNADSSSEPLDAESSDAESSKPEPADAIDSTFRHTFNSLPAGNYAVAIYHDRNGDERLNRGLFGIPEEGYGFSNDAPANFGPADFAAAVFTLEDTDATIAIRMRYP